MELMLVRHTEVGVEPGIIYGRTDVPLAATFEAERQDVARRVAHFWPAGPTAVVASPATRARLLAEHLASVHMDLEIEYDERLLEVNFGTWELERWDDVDRVELDRWMNDYVNVQPPGGESMQDVATRVMPAIHQVVDSGHARTMIVCHGAVIRAVLATLLHIPLRNSFSLEIDKGSVSRVKFRGPDKTPIILGVNYR
jgi:alpha-ribazole phosphatase